jgi:hypothetical protein
VGQQAATAQPLRTSCAGAVSSCQSGQLAAPACPGQAADCTAQVGSVATSVGELHRDRLAAAQQGGHHRLARVLDLHVLARVDEVGVVQRQLLQKVEMLGGVQSARAADATRLDWFSVSSCRKGGSNLDEMQA